MPRKTIAQCEEQIRKLQKDNEFLSKRVNHLSSSAPQKEIEALKQSVEILGNEVVKRNAFILEVEAKLAAAKVTAQEEEPHHIRVRLHKDVVAIAERLQKTLSIYTPGDVVAHALNALEEREKSTLHHLKNQVRYLWSQVVEITRSR
jgi:hypothetical protein